MSGFKFISHEKFPDDPYVHETAYLEVNGVRVLYVRKATKTGGKFWTVPNISVLKDGNKEFLETSMIDSNFLTTDIKNFLDKREWNKAQSSSTATSFVDPVSFDGPW